MSDPIRFTVLGKPAPAGSKRGFVVKGRVVITDASKRARPWKALVTDKAIEAMGRRPLLEGPLIARFVFYRARPKSHYGAKGLKLSAPLMPIAMPDVGKTVRGSEDAMTRVVWRDDAQIVAQIAIKRYGLPERMEVEVWSLEEELEILIGRMPPVDKSVDPVEITAQASVTAPPLVG